MESLVAMSACPSWYERKWHRPFTTRLASLTSKTYSISERKPSFNFLPPPKAAYGWQNFLNLDKPRKTLDYSNLQVHEG